MVQRHKIMAMALAFSAFWVTARVSFADDTAVAQRAHAVLKKHCYSCHGEQGTIEGGVNYVLSGRLLKSRGVNAGAKVRRVAGRRNCAASF